MTMDKKHNGLRILVAEDDLEMRNFLAVSLRRDGYDVVEAKTGVELISLLVDATLDSTAVPYDLVISDQRMPGFLGLEVLAGPQDDDWPPPYIMITAFGSKEFETLAYGAGAAAVFNKPFDMDDLKSAIVSILGRSAAS
jgi:DNA-binding response OmpR family regulator